MQAPGLLDGYRVLELAGVLAGPSAGMFFAELGAEVIKVENALTGGDITRQWKLPGEDPRHGTSAYFCSANWGKRHLLLDLTNEEHRRQVYELVPQTDIVICNFKHGDDLKLGMDYARLRSMKEDIIYAALSAFGEDDPRVAYDLVLQAEGGLMFMNGTPGSGPLKMPLAMVDILAAHQLKEAILLALLKKERTGKGSHIACSLFRSAVSALTNQASNWLMAGFLPQRAGSMHPNIAPYGETVLSADGKEIVMAVGTDAQFRKLCRALDMPALAEDPLFAGNSSRVANRVLLISRLREGALNYSASALMNRLNANGVPAGMIKNMAEVFDNPMAQEMILEENVDGIPTKRVSSISFNIT